MKKPNCLLLILVITCCASARAQAQPHHPVPPLHRWSFNASAGVAFPIGQFARTRSDDPKSGPVHTGSLIEFSTTYHLSRTWGLTLLANRQQHHSEVDEIINPGGPATPELPVPGPLGAPPAYTPIGPQHWTMTRILAGGVYTLPLNQKKNLAFLFRALAGVQKTHVSQYEYFLIQQNVTASASFPSRNLGWALSYQADAGLQWKVYRRWSLLAFAGYNGCRAPYKQDVTQLIYYNGVYSPHIFKRIYFPTGSILVRAGVGFDL